MPSLATKFGDHIRSECALYLRDGHVMRTRNSLPASLFTPKGNYQGWSCARDRRARFFGNLESCHVPGRNSQLGRRWPESANRSEKVLQRYLSVSLAPPGCLPVLTSGTGSPPPQRPNCGRTKLSVPAAFCYPISYAVFCLQKRREQ